MSQIQFFFGCPVLSAKITGKFELNVRSIRLPKQAKFPQSSQHSTSIIDKIHLLYVVLVTVVTNRRTGITKQPYNVHNRSKCIESKGELQGYAN